MQEAFEHLRFLVKHLFALNEMIDEQVCVIELFCLGISFLGVDYLHEVNQTWIN
jgi:hypothetical protein